MPTSPLKEAFPALENASLPVVKETLDFALHHEQKIDGVGFVHVALCTGWVGRDFEGDYLGGVLVFLLVEVLF